MTGKPAPMDDKLTSQKIEHLRLSLKLLTDYDSSVNEDEIDALCDQALSLESVRSEALADIKLISEEYLLEKDLPRSIAWEIKEFTDTLCSELSIRALKGKGASQGADERIYTKADMEAACALVLAGFRSKPMLDKMVDRFLAWPLPFSVCADLIATEAAAWAHRYESSECRRIASNAGTCARHSRTRSTRQGAAGGSGGDGEAAARRSRF